MSNAYTPAQVIAALDQARGRTAKTAALLTPAP
jgi:hypothetical protein